MTPSRPGIKETANLGRLRGKTGTYVLLFELETICRLAVGKLGQFDFPPGWYTYTGSARGPGGLTARLRHHLSIAAHPHWHMDYVRPHARITDIWYARSLLYDEHRWAAVLAAMAGQPAVAPFFGSSDCRCATHLIHFGTGPRPTLARFRRRQEKTPGRRPPPIGHLAISGT